MMRTQFQKDIESLPKLKKGFFVTLASTVIFSVLTVASIVCHVVGKNTDFPITNSEEKELLEIAEDDESYKQTCHNFKLGFKSELDAGTMTQEQYDENIEYLESPEFINNIVSEDKTAAINQKVADRKKSLEGCDKYAAISALLAAGSAVATGMINKKRNKLKNRWFDEEEARGL